MRDFHPEHLAGLLDEGETPRISAYLPTIRAGDTEQNTTRFRNLLRGVRGALEDAEVDKRDAARVIEMLEEELSGDAAEHQAEGLAVFATLNGCLLLRCRRTFAPLLTVGGAYHVLPLLPLVDEARQYWILAVSRECTRLVSAYRDRGQEHDLSGSNVPRRLTDVVGRELEEQSLQHASKQRDRQGVFHAQGRGDADDELPELEQYCRVLGAAVAAEIAHEPAPVVLAGEVRITSVFRQAADAPATLERTIQGNHDATPVDDLAAAGWEILMDLLEREEAEARERYSREVGNGRAGDDVGMLVEAAAAGRIDTLLIAERLLSDTAGERPPDSIRRHGRSPSETEAVANRIALETLRHGGATRVLGTAPTDSPLAAVLRY